MKTDYIKTFEGQYLAIIETDDEGNQIIRDWPGRQKLGTYYVKENVTRDFYGRIIGRGNVLTTLIKSK